MPDVEITDEILKSMLDEIRQLTPKQIEERLDKHKGNSLGIYFDESGAMQRLEPKTTPNKPPSNPK